MQLEDLKFELNKSQIVWIGETHGVAENYLAHKELIQLLFSLGFRTVLWEMPPDLEMRYEDGRFSRESDLFSAWLDEMSGRGILSNVVRFDIRKDVEGMSIQEIEGVLYKGLEPFLQDKIIVISGGFHSQSSVTDIDGEKVLPCAGLVGKLHPEFSILKIGYRYAGGEMYNFGVRKIEENLPYFDPDNKPFGIVLLNDTIRRDEDYWFCVGHASPIIPN